MTRGLYDKGTVLLTHKKHHMLTLNALTAADKVIIPVQSRCLHVKGLEQLLKTVGKVRRQLNSNLQISGILITMVEGRSTFSHLDFNSKVASANAILDVYPSDIPPNIESKSSRKYSAAAGNEKSKNPENRKDTVIIITS